jgi:hypothetical protein
MKPEEEGASDLRIFAPLGLSGVQDDHQVWYEHVHVDVRRGLYDDSHVQV